MLTPCPRCRRHVRASERCPFCPATRATGLALALPLAASLGLAASGCGGGVTTLEPRETGGNTNGGEQRTPPDDEPSTPPDDAPIRTAPAYGAAPLPPAPPPEERQDDPRPVAAYGGPSMPMGPTAPPPNE